MHFKDFLQWMRKSGERYIVLDADGEPEFVIEPFAKHGKISTVEKINETLAAVAEKEREEINGWDTMAEVLHKENPSPVGEGGPVPYQREVLVSGGEVSATGEHDIIPSATKPENDEPKFQFEAIDE